MFRSLVVFFAFPAVFAAEGALDEVSLMQMKPALSEELGELDELDGSDESDESVSVTAQNPPCSNREVFEATMGRYPGYTGDLNFEGSVSFAASALGDDLLVSWRLSGLEAGLCTGERTAPGKCGIAVHYGSTCDDHRRVSRRFYRSRLNADPWASIMYQPDAHGTAMSTNNIIHIGQQFSWLNGRAVVVHDHTGRRVACGIVRPIGLPPAHEWTLVLQYGETSYTPTAEAVGIVDESKTQFAKLADEAINALPSGGEGDYDYYLLTSDSPDGVDTIFARVTGAYNDLATELGFTSFETCPAASLEQCTSWFRSSNRRGLDTYSHMGANNDCRRWLTASGGSSRYTCYAEPRSGQRCWSVGNRCSWGSYSTRTNFKMYRKTA